MRRIGLWFINHALYLKYYVLFVGIATALYFAWDISKCEQACYDGLTLIGFQ